MISIYVHSSSQPGFLDIPEDVQLTIESYTEAFQEEEEAGEFSLPIDLYWTDNNRRILGFKERLENFNRTNNYFIVSVYDDNFPEMPTAKLTLLSKSGNFSYRNGKFSASISGTRGIFASAIKNKKLADLPLGGVVNFPAGMDSRQFAQWHYTTGYTQYPQFRFGPVGWENFYDQQRYDFNGEFLAKDTVNNVVQLTAGSWVFGRPAEANPGAAALPSTQEYCDYGTVPFYSVLFLLEKCFTDMGYKVSGNIFTSGEFNNLVLFNNYRLERYYRGFLLVINSRDLTNFIDPRNHVPDMLVYDFLKAILPGLGVFINFIDDKTVVLVDHNTNIKSSPAINMDDVLVDDFEARFADGNALNNGYKISYSTDSDDQYYSERAKELDGRTVAGRKPTVAALDDINPGVFTTNDVVYVEAENMYYAVADATTNPMKWDAFSEKLDTYVKGKGEISAEIKFSTLAQYVLKNEATGLYENQGYLATRQHGSYITDRGVKVVNSFGLRLFYCTPPGNTAISPVTYNHNRNADNTIKEKYSLALSLADGISQRLIPFRDILENAEVVEVQFIANKEVMQRLQHYKKVMIQGVQCFVKKIEKTVPMDETVPVELIPI